MKYAIVEVRGKQYRVEEGHTFAVDLLPTEAGEELVFDTVLLYVDGENVAVGSPFVKGASVKTRVVEHFKGKKILVFKYKPKISYRRHAGHRQRYTRLMVESIVTE